MYKKSMLAWTIAVLLFMTSNGISIGEDGKETGKVRLAKEQYQKLVEKKVDFLLSVKVEEHEYSALQSTIDRFPIKYLERCSDLYNIFISEYGPTFQSWANKNCRNYIGVWCCPYGGCFVFLFKPYTLCNWKEPIYVPTIPVWEWPQVQIIGEGTLTI